MAINPHHSVEEINGIRCSIIEKNIDAQRADFLKKILEYNGYSVQTSSNENETMNLGVTDLLFNLKYMLYSRKLKALDGTIITPAIWYQKNQKGEFYWQY